ncbi:MAG: deoxyribose-phosphate aldolase [Lachnospiraceae bacterium]|nr:deoxyribose-phosphate aldolase [Lachnospiraceae bacterium]
MKGIQIESRIYETPKTYDSVKCLCYEAVLKGFKSVQMFPCMVSMCHDILKDTDVVINALIDYPHGGFLTSQKVEEAKEAVELGAKSVQVMMNTRKAKAQDFAYIENEMRAVKEALPAGTTVKFIIEIEYLTDDEIKSVCDAAVKAGIDYISMSSGLYHTLDENKNDVPLVAKVSDVKMLKELLGGKVKIQAEGYVNTKEAAEGLLEAGADLVASEKAYELVK